MTATGNPAVGIQIGDRLLFDLIELNRLGLVRILEFLKEKTGASAEVGSESILPSGFGPGAGSLSVVICVGGFKLVALQVLRVCCKDPQ